MNIGDISWKNFLTKSANFYKIIDVVNDVLGTNLNTIQDLLTFTNSKLDAAIEIFGKAFSKNS